jgi:hypothetical protein
MLTSTTKTKLINVSAFFAALRSNIPKDARGRVQEVQRGTPNAPNDAQTEAEGRKKFKGEPRAPPDARGKSLGTRHVF